MITTWEYSKTKEALRLLHVAHQIACGFYKLNGFIVLPYPNPQSHEQIVTFPDLPYLTISRFWEQATRINIKDFSNLEIETKPQFLSHVLKLLPEFPVPNYQATQLLWSKYEQSILNCIYALIPSKANSIKSIIIWPTVLGTSCSFSYFNHQSGQIIIWLRQDKGIAFIVEAVLSALTRIDVYENLCGIWQESEIIVDWLMAYSPLNSILKQADPNWDSTLTIKHTRTKQNGAFTEQSEKFLQKIGAPTVNPAQIKLDHFSPRDQEIMQLLISSSPRPATMDQIGNILFKNHPENYSLYAISKSIQRLRDQLESHGISGSFIQTKRGEGYLLLT